MTPLTFPWEEVGKLGSLQKPWALIPFTTYTSAKRASSKFGNSGSPKHTIHTLLHFSCIENLHGDISTTQMMLQGGQHQARTPVTSNQPLAMQSLAISMDLHWAGFLDPPGGDGEVSLDNLCFVSYYKLPLAENVGAPCSSVTSHDTGIGAPGACSSYLGSFLTACTLCYHE